MPWVPVCGETAVLPSPSGAMFVWSISIPQEKKKKKIIVIIIFTTICVASASQVF